MVTSRYELASYLDALGVVGLNQSGKRRLGHQHPDLREKPLAFIVLFVRGQLVLREGKRLAHHLPYPELRSEAHCPADQLGFQESL